MTSLYDDPRWVALHAGKLPCSSCGEVHEGLFDLVSDKPDAWAGPAVRTPKSEVAARLDDVLVDDFCIIGDSYFVRCDLDLPVIGAPGQLFTFGTWTRVLRQDFQRYVAWLNAGRQGMAAPMTGWLANSLKGYPETHTLSCRLTPRSVLPSVTMLEPHLLAQEQRSGISFGRILDLYAVNGHDLRIELLAPEGPQRAEAKAKVRGAFMLEAKATSAVLADTTLQIAADKT